jgi:DNA-binding transcriptional ArsR family regulator
VSVEAPGPIVVSYPANGSGNIWETSRSPDQGVEALMGRTRARILHSVQSPATTTHMAADLDLAPATVSAHLSTLTSAGLVHRTRQGRLVLYARTLLGSRLLGHAHVDQAWSTMAEEAGPYAGPASEDVEYG